MLWEVLVKYINIIVMFQRFPMVITNKWLVHAFS